jgi:hypothetical protein
MDYIKRIIMSDQKKNRLFNLLMEKNQNCWRKFSGSDEILLWLNNFSNEAEIYLALILANGILYYTQDEIMYLWKLILMNRVKLFLLKEEFGTAALPDVEVWFPEYLRTKCIFIGYGRAGKSGQAMVYYFKKSQGIEDLNYMELYEFIHASRNFGTIERVFLLDDFVGTGDQAVETWYLELDGKSVNHIHEKYHNLKFSYLALAGFTAGKEEIEKAIPIKVILGQELDKRFQCFSDISVIYEDPIERETARKVMTEKGRMLYAYPLGYGGMELAVAFCHNTPDDSLPVIWKKMTDGSWFPLFERHE